MRWRQLEGRFVLLGFPELPVADDYACLGGAAPAQITREGGETSILAEERFAPAIEARHDQVRREGGLVWFTFEASMEWDVVGFLALVTGALADAGVPVGAVCGFSRDHLFVSESYLAKCRQVLGQLFTEA